MHFVDFLSVLNDTELQSGISGALQTALTDLKTALEGIISSKMEDTTQLGEGLTVMSPIRADQQKLPDLYQYLAMTDVGNSSVWTQFTLKLHAVAKEAGLISDNLPENTLNFVVPTRNFSATVPINTTTTTITTVQAPKRSLGPLGITSGLVFDHLQYVTKTEPQWYFFRVFKTDENTFSELTLDFSQATVENTFTVTVYGEDTTTGKYTVTKDAWSFSENAAGKVVIDLSTLDLNPDPSKYMNYAIRVYSADATTEYSMKYMLTDGSSHEIKAKSVDLLDDMVNESQNNNSADTAFSLDGNYYSGMTVYSGYSDWYQTNLLDCSITVKVYDSNTDLSTTPTLNVEQ